jgi:hypothetical protein
VSALSLWWKSFARTTKLGIVAVLALAITPLPWPQPGELPRPQAGEAPALESDTQFALDQGPCCDPLLEDLENGFWKAGDTVEAVSRRYRYIRSLVIKGFAHGEFTTWRHGVPIRAHLEVVAVHGKLRAAGIVLSLIPQGDGRFDRVYFDTLTEAEWAAYDISSARAVAAFQVTYGLLEFLKAFLLGPGGFIVFGR